ncbi:MAG: PLP-dependent aminotransferase family protein [Pseudomonadota bacterium]
MDYALLIKHFANTHPVEQWSQQRILHEGLRAAIRSGALAGGTRLLATRTLAQELGVARNSVLYAYEQLATEGYVLPDRRGTVVATGRGLVAPMHRPPLKVGLSRRTRALQALPAPTTLPAGFAPGVPALDEFPLPVWRRLVERAWRAARPDDLNYGDPAGHPQLRDAIASHLRAASGADCHAHQVFITNGTQASLDLCARAFADAGEVAWIENPGYAGALTALRGAQLEVHHVPTDGDGIKVRAQDWQRHRPRLVYVTPSHQYPTGAVLSLERRLALIEGARQARALIIEDDYDSEFRHDGPPLPAMQGLAPDAPVLYLGTFSKTMFPALRIGFMVVPQALVAPLEEVLARSSPRGRSAEQLALAEFLRSGHFALHLRRMRRLYRQRRDALLAALQTHMADLGEARGGSAGMHLMFELRDKKLDDSTISARALAQGIVAHPLSLHGRLNGFLLGYAQVPAERMDALVRRFARIVRA